MRIALTGASGVVGRFIAQSAVAAGHKVTAFGRSPVTIGALTLPFRAWQLGETADLRGHDALVHAAFLHKQGRYRGGEGDDPAGFWLANVDGSLKLFQEARESGVGRAIFLSSRAVFDGYPAGTRLAETLPPAPTSLYGEAKAAVEASLADLDGPGFRTASVRATGVYGQAPGGPPHKWAELFRSFLAGDPIAARIATEIHGTDLAAAILLVLNALGPKDRGPTSGAPMSLPRSKDGSQGGLHPPGEPVSTKADSLLNSEAGASRPDHRLSGRAILPRRQDGLSRISGLPSVIHVSDLLLDYRDLLDLVAKAASLSVPANLPPRSHPDGVSILSCPTLARLGWQPGGTALLARTVGTLVQCPESPEPSRDQS